MTISGELSDRHLVKVTLNTRNSTNKKTYLTLDIISTDNSNEHSVPELTSQQIIRSLSINNLIRTVNQLQTFSKKIPYLVDANDVPVENSQIEDNQEFENYRREYNNGYQCKIIDVEPIKHYLGNGEFYMVIYLGNDIPDGSEITIIFDRVESFTVQAVQILTLPLDYQEPEYFYLNRR